MSSFQRVVCTGFNGVGTLRCVPIREVSSFQRVVCTGFNGVGELGPEDVSEIAALQLSKRNAFPENGVCTVLIFPS